MMNSHINGWPTIEKWLKIRGKTQTELGMALGISPSAVSQIKKGSILLKSEQLANISDFLKFDENTNSLFYSALFEARLMNESSLLPGDKNEVRKLKLDLKLSHALPGGLEVAEGGENKKSPKDRLPMVKFDQLGWYEPAFESIGLFAARHTEEPFATQGREGDFAVLLEDGRFLPCFPPGSIVLVAGNDYPVSDEMVMTRFQNGRLVIGRYIKNGDQGELVFIDETKVTWHNRIDINFIHWMHPVIEVIIKMNR